MRSFVLMWNINLFYFHAAPGRDVEVQLRIYASGKTWEYINSRLIFEVMKAWNSITADRSK